ncbi:MAG: hypothetical protein AVDCRST_MAG89-1985, partial [uncultured Gemmatimonadetes bacterium]
GAPAARRWASGPRSWRPGACAPRHRGGPFHPGTPRNAARAAPAGGTPGSCRCGPGRAAAWCPEDRPGPRRPAGAPRAPPWCRAPWASRESGRTRWCSPAVPRPRGSRPRWARAPRRRPCGRSPRCAAAPPRRESRSAPCRPL